MDPLLVGILGVLLSLILLLLGVHVAIALGLAGTLGIFFIIGLEATTNLLATTLLQYGTMYSMIVVPLFIAMGLFAAETGISRDSYDILTMWLGGIKGSLGLATVGACTAFGALTGSSIATSVVFAKVSAPEMCRHGYDKHLTYSLVAASGAIGMMIPPSILAIIYGIISEESIGRLLLGGVGPGLTLAACLGGGLIALLTFWPKLGSTGRLEKPNLRHKLRALPKLWPILVVGVIVIGGIYSGIATVTEAAGIGSFTLFVLYIAFRGFSRQSLTTLGLVLRESLSVTGMIFLIFCFAQVFTRLLVLSGIAEILGNYVIGLALSKIQFICAAAVLYIFLGMFIDSISILMVTVPIFLPVISALGIDPTWFAMVLILAVEIGLITPPMGINIYAVKGVAGSDVELVGLFRAAVPWFFCMVLALALVILFPQISIWVPNHMLGR